MEATAQMGINAWKTRGAAWWHANCYDCKPLSCLFVCFLLWKIGWVCGILDRIRSYMLNNKMRKKGRGKERKKEISCSCNLFTMRLLNLRHMSPSPPLNMSRAILTIIYQWCRLDNLTVCTRTWDLHYKAGFTRHPVQKDSSSVFNPELQTIQRSSSITTQHLLQSHRRD